MRHLWHRNVVLLFEVLDDSSTERIGLVMEFCSGGCSMNYDEADRRFISSTTGSVLPEPLAARYFGGIAQGLLYLRDRCIAHRDIKPENCAFIHWRARSVLCRSLRLRVPPCCNSAASG